MAQNPNLSTMFRQLSNRQEILQKCITMLEYGLRIEKMNGHIFLSQGMFKKRCGKDYIEVMDSIAEEGFGLLIEDYAGLIIDEEPAKQAISFYSQNIKQENKPI